MTTATTPSERNSSSTMPDDDKSIASSTASATGSNINRNLASTEEERLLARAKNHRIVCLRFLFFAFWLVSACLLSWAVYDFVSNDQVEEFENSFEVQATKVLDRFLESMENNLGALGSMSTSITSFAQAMQMTFPNVTIADFQLRGSNSRILLNAGTIFYAPLVTEETRAGWEAFAAGNIATYPQQFMSETKTRFQQDAQFGYSVPTPAKPQTRHLEGEEEAPQEEGQQLGSGENQTVPQQQQQQTFPERFIPKIWAPHEATPTPLPPGLGPYLPIWQTSPLLPTAQLINVDMAKLPFYGPGVRSTLAYGEAIIHPVTQLLEPGTNHTETRSIADSFLLLNQFRHNQDEFSNEPVSPISYPVFARFGDSTIGGVLLTNMYWKTFFSGILPEGTEGIICVIRNTANQTFSFRLDGPNVTYIGKQDMHDIKYDHLVEEGEVSSFIQQRSSPSNRAYTTVKLNNGNSTSYTLSVYPSESYENGFIDNKPVLYTVVVAAAFVVSALFFVLYDFLVERRQSIVMDTAIKSGVLVNSLFPETVRDRLYAKQEKDQKKDRKKVPDWNASQKLETMLQEGSAPFNPYDEEAEDNENDAIADEFPETTIMFADLAGFTKWSKEKQAKDVFHLLETVYGAFDKIAVKRRVFKVETIGDCYMACAGLPKPQPDHAILMVKFARDCMTKMKEVTKGLENRLGPDVMDLDFRVGLHSGAVTAGVIRGDRSRFQLFGDTVNTASRMETNGVKGRIHVSQATADKLILAGYQKWLVPREGGVEAKGLGLLATYFVEPDGAKTNTASISIGEVTERDEDDEVLPFDGSTRSTSSPTRSVGSPTGSCKERM